LACAVVAALAVAPQGVVAQKQYAPGVTDTEIKIGQTMPYSGPASAYGVIGQAEAAYFKTVNAAGGVNGRKINLLSLDDGYSPPKTVEQTRRLVEEEEVALIFSPLGTPTSVVVRKYLNDHGVPQIFITSGASFWNDPQHYPWTMGFQPNYKLEGRAYGRYILAGKGLVKPGEKVALMYQNDDAGRDYADGFKEGLGPEGVKRIAATQTYEVTSPTLDSQVATMQSSGATILFDNTTPKFAAMLIRRMYDIGWHPVHFLSNTSASIAAVMVPAGVDKSQGIVSTAYLKDPLDKQWANDPATQAYLAWMKKDYPAGNPADYFNVLGYTAAQTMVHVLTACGDNLTRQNIMHQTESLNLALPMMLPGIRVTTSPTDHAPIKQVIMERLQGDHWVLFGDAIGG